MHYWQPLVIQRSHDYGLRSWLAAVVSGSGDPIPCHRTVGPPYGAQRHGAHEEVAQHTSSSDAEKPRTETLAIAWGRGLHLAKSRDVYGSHAQTTVSQCCLLLASHGSCPWSRIDYRQSHDMRLKPRSLSRSRPGNSLRSCRAVALLCYWGSARPSLVFDRCPSNNRSRLGRALNWIDGKISGFGWAVPGFRQASCRGLSLNQLVAEVWNRISRLGEEQALGSCTARVGGAGVGSDGVRCQDASLAPTNSFGFH